MPPHLFKTNLRAVFDRVIDVNVDNEHSKSTCCYYLCYGNSITFNYRVILEKNSAAANCASFQSKPSIEKLTIVTLKEYL